MLEQNSIYLLEERRYRLNDDGVLELVLNDDGNNVQRVVNGLGEFNITAILNDDSGTLTSAKLRAKTGKT